MTKFGGQFSLASHSKFWGLVFLSPRDLRQWLLSLFSSCDLEFWPRSLTYRSVVDSVKNSRCHISMSKVISFKSYCPHTHTHTHTVLTALPGSLV